MANQGILDNKDTPPMFLICPSKYTLFDKYSIFLFVEIVSELMVDVYQRVLDTVEKEIRDAKQRITKKISCKMFG